MSAFVKSYAINQFNKHFDIKSSKSQNYDSAFSNIKAVQEVYRPRRYYRRKNAPPDDKETRIQITILEYGRRANTTVPSRTNDLDEEIMEDRKTEEVCFFVFIVVKCFIFIILFYVCFCWHVFSYKLNNSCKV